jgi:hypothetical protein
MTIDHSDFFDFVLSITLDKLPKRANNSNPIQHSCFSNYLFISLFFGRFYIIIPVFSVGTPYSTWLSFRVFSTALKVVIVNISLKETRK